MNVAIIGFGSAGKKHLIAWDKLGERITRIHLFDVRKSIQHLPVSSAVSIRHDWTEVVRDPDIDVVDICLPHYLHEEVAIAAINAGKHVLIEKPISHSLASARRILVAAKKSQNVIAVAENWVFSPAVQVAIREIERGVIGTPIMARSVVDFNPGDSGDWYYNVHQSGGGVLLSTGIHVFAVLRRIFGEPRKIVALAGAASKQYYGIEEDVGVIAEFWNSQIAVCSLTRTLPVSGKRFLFSVLGTEGVVEWAVGGPYVRIGSTCGKKIEKVKRSMGFDETIEHFVECIVCKKEPATSIEEEIKTLEFVCGARDSISWKNSIFGRVGLA